MVEALECVMIVEEKEVMNARNLAISIKSQFCVTGRDTEVVAVQAGLKERGQPVQEEEVRMGWRTRRWSGRGRSAWTIRWTEPA